MYDVNIYENSSEILKRQEERIYIKFIIFMLVIFGFLIGIVFISYPDEYVGDGYVSNGEISMYLNDEALAYFDVDTIEVNENKTSYEVVSLNILEDNSSLYKMSLMTKKNLVENSIVKVKITKGKTNLYRSFIKKIWKGF